MALRVYAACRIGCVWLWEGGLFHERLQRPRTPVAVACLSVLTVCVCVCVCVRGGVQCIRLLGVRYLSDRVRMVYPRYSYDLFHVLERQGPLSEPKCRVRSQLR